LSKFEERFIFTFFEGEHASFGKIIHRRKKGGFEIVFIIQKGRSLVGILTGTPQLE